MSESLSRGRQTSRIAGTVFFTLPAHISIGLPLAVIPCFTHPAIGFDPVIAGLSVSLQSLATFATRGPTGRVVDTVGPGAPC